MRPRGRRAPSFRLTAACSAPAPGRIFPWTRQGCRVYPWDTTQTYNGRHVVLVRAKDIAGNEEHTAQVVVNVRNPFKIRHEPVPAGLFLAGTRPWGAHGGALGGGLFRSAPACPPRAWRDHGQDHEGEGRTPLPGG